MHDDVQEGDLGSSPGPRTSLPCQLELALWWFPAWKSDVQGWVYSAFLRWDLITSQGSRYPQAKHPHSSASSCININICPGILAPTCTSFHLFIGLGLSSWLQVLEVEIFWQSSDFSILVLCENKKKMNWLNETLKWSLDMNSFLKIPDDVDCNQGRKVFVFRVYCFPTGLILKTAWCTLEIQVPRSFP